jgi:hypothetical protein
LGNDILLISMARDAAHGKVIQSVIDILHSPS